MPFVPWQTMEWICASFELGITLKKRLLSSSLRWKTSFETTTRIEICSLIQMPSRSTEIKLFWFLIMQAFTVGLTSRTSVWTEDGWVLPYQLILLSSILSSWCSEQPRQNYIDRFALKRKNFNTRAIEFKAIDVMKELDDSNLAWMIFYSIRQNVTAEYTARGI